MTWLLALVWALYASECVVRHGAGAIVFRGRRIGALRAVVAPDLELAEGRLSFTWAALLPWHFGFATTEAPSHGRARQARLELLRAIRHTRPLQIASGALFLVLLAGMPVLVLTDRLSATVPLWLPVLASTWLTTVLLFFGAYREIHRQMPPLEVWMMVVLSPLATIRAPAHVLGSVTRQMSPLVVASIVCSNDELLKLFRRVYFDTPAARPDLERLLKSRQLGTSLLRPPAAEPGMQTYCPRCHTLYSTDGTSCADCRHVELRRFTPAPTALDTPARTTRA